MAHIGASNGNIRSNRALNINKGPAVKAEPLFTFAPANKASFGSSIMDKSVAVKTSSAQSNNSNKKHDTTPKTSVTPQVDEASVLDIQESSLNIAKAATAENIREQAVVANESIVADETAKMTELNNIQDVEEAAEIATTAEETELADNAVIAEQALQPAVTPAETKAENNPALTAVDVNQVAAKNNDAKEASEVSKSENSMKVADAKK